MLFVNFSGRNFCQRSIRQRNSSRNLQKIRSHPVSPVGILEALDTLEPFWKTWKLYDVKIGSTFTGMLLVVIRIIDSQDWWSGFESVKKLFRSKRWLNPGRCFKFGPILKKNGRNHGSSSFPLKIVKSWGIDITHLLGEWDQIQNTFMITIIISIHIYIRIWQGSCKLWTWSNKNTFRNCSEFGSDNLFLLVFVNKLMIGYYPTTLSHKLYYLLDTIVKMFRHARSLKIGRAHTFALHIYYLFFLMITQ